MKHIIGRMRAGLASGAVLIAAPLALADATHWANSLPGGPDMLLSLSGVDQSEAALAALARSAELDWLPTTHRLLIATNLLPGADTSRALAIAFEAGDDESGLLRFVAVIPTDRPAILAANFEALPSADHPGLFAFSFAQRDYLARVLPDDHLAISNSPELLNSLKNDRVENSGPDDHTSPIRLTLRGENSVRLLQSMFSMASPTPQQTNSEPMFPWPEGVEAIQFHLTPSAEFVNIGMQLIAQPGSEFASQWKRSGEIQLEPIPLPNTEAVLVVQGSMKDHATRAFFLPLGAQLLGIAPDAMPEADSFALLIEPPANPVDFSGLTNSLMLTSDNAEQTRTELRRAIGALPGVTMSPDASTRVGVSIDRFTISTGANGMGQPERRRGMAGFLPGPRPSQNGAIEGRMFSRNGRVCLTTASTPESLDRLIAFGPDSTSIESSGTIGDWLAKLPREAGGRLALNIESTVRLYSMFSSLGGTRANTPKTIPPIVASLQTLDAKVQVDIIIPAETIKVLDQIRSSAATLRPRTPESPE